MLHALHTALTMGLTVLMNWVSPLGLTIRRDVPYAPGPAHTADVYAAGTPSARPVIVYFYGGGWRGGAKERIAFIGAALARRGFVVVVPEYRHFPGADLMGMLADQSAAVTWTLGHAAEIGGDPRRVILAGHSSGAWSAAMLALDPRWLGATGSAPGQLAGMIGLAGPYMVSSLTERIDRAVFEGTGREMEPVSHAAAPHPPLLLLSGAADTDVLPISTVRLAEEARAGAGTVACRFYAGVGHEGLPRGFLLPFARGPSVTDDIATFAASLQPR